MVTLASSSPETISASSFPALILTKKNSLPSATVSSTKITGMAAVEDPPAGRVTLPTVVTRTSTPTMKDSHD